MRYGDAGGFALDLRLAERARATKDIDIDWQAAEEELLDALIDAAAYAAGDFFKDLVDLSLIAELSALDAARLRSAIDEIFAGRGTHRVPDRLPEPPESWRVPFRQWAEAVGVSTETSEAHAQAAAVIDPILSGEIKQGTWKPGARAWGDHA